jgi:AraC-like DNA-binding protein
MQVDWRKLRPRIVWTRCNRRRWEATPELTFSREQRRKPRHVLLYFWAGRGVRRVPDGEVVVAPGACHWSRPGWSYACRQSSSDPLGITAIHFDLVGGDSQVVRPADTVLPPEVLAVTVAGVVQEATAHIAGLAMQIRSGVSVEIDVQRAAEALLRGLLLQLAADTAGNAATGRADAAMWAEVPGFIQENLGSLPSAEELARRWGYSRHHFSRRFSTHFGLSPQAYIVNARLALAKELLRETELSVTQIAARAGFNSLARFSNSFRAAAAVSPSEYRRLQAEG